LCAATASAAIKASPMRPPAEKQDAYRSPIGL
jgi:hypothetical protein